MTKYFPGKRLPGDIRIGRDDEDLFVILAIGVDFELTLWMTGTQLMKYKPIAYSSQAIKVLNTYVDIADPVM